MYENSPGGGGGGVDGGAISHPQKTLKLPRTRLDALPGGLGREESSFVLFIIFPDCVDTVRPRSDIDANPVLYRRVTAVPRAPEVAPPLAREFPRTCLALSHALLALRYIDRARFRRFDTSIARPLQAAAAIGA